MIYSPGCGKPQSPSADSAPSAEDNQAEVANVPIQDEATNAKELRGNPGDEFDTQFQLVQSAESESLRLILDPIEPDQLDSLSELPNLLDLLLDAGGVDDSSMQVIGQLSQLEHLRIRQSQLTDAGITNLCSGELPELAILNLPQAHLTVQAIGQLAKLPALVQLRLGGKTIDDAAVAAIAKLPNLRSLHLIGPQLTDKSLEYLAAAPKLASLYLDDCPLSDSAWQLLFDAKPNIHVHVDQHHHDRDPSAHQHP